VRGFRKHVAEPCLDIKVDWADFLSAIDTGKRLGNAHNTGPKQENKNKGFPGKGGQVLL